MVYLKNVVTLSLNKDKCNGCGMCINVCPHSVYKIIEKKAEIINKDNCIECGACVKNCLQNAIFVKVGVGCANALYLSKIFRKEIECGCSNNKGSCC